MTEPLFDPPTPELPRNQQLAFDYIQDGGATAADVGHHIHLQRDPPCAWCRLGPCNYSEQTGRDVLKGLRRKGLVVRRRSGLWERVGDKSRKPTTGGPGELPDDF